MSELLHQLGIDGRLLLSQGVNFGIVLAVLTFFVYKPLVKILNERREKIEFGLRGAEVVEKKLKEMEEIKVLKIQEGEKQAFEIVKTAETKAGERGEEIVSEAEVKAEELLAKAALIEEQRKLETLAKLSEESKSMIKKALVKMVNLKPDAIDEALIEEAAGEIKKFKA